ncbi:ATPase family protein associated with various cellular activities (AAA) [Blastococcus colisei]|uniref:ATPase family protein associated with various cellular activities (AAA) n=1 Tax=Blastococcus colisei TaxID=1564162 RepID=A0A543PFP1_9ACTN|nr:ATP-binding protein [Blastococcus colisei]TQN42894.1 ATPase family protein associated with various cellular activities (AAA) [Blastococcus colisei]
MSDVDVDAVRRDNDDRLMDATMTWLRALLVPPTRRSRADGPAEPAAPEAVAVARWWGRKETLRPPPVAPAERDPRAAARRARKRLEGALAADPAPRFTRMCDVLGMSPFERDVALLCVAHAVSTEVARLCRAMPESTSGAPTFALSLGLAMDAEFDSVPPERRKGMTRVAAAPEWAALGPDRPLRYWRLIDIAQGPAQALVSSALRMDERVVDHVRGRDHLDDRLASVVDAVPSTHGDAIISATQRTRLVAALRSLQRAAPGRSRLLVQMPGADATTKRLFARWIADAVDRELHRLSLDQIPGDVDLTTAVDLWNRETRLLDVALLVGAPTGTDETTPILSRLLSRLTGLVFLDVREPLPEQDTALVLDALRPDAAEQRAMWEQVLTGTAGDWPERLAGQFRLNGGEIAAVADSVADDDAGADEAGERTWDACRLRARPRLEGLAQRIVTDTTLADVQLPDRERRLLEQVRDQTRHRVRVYDEYGFRSRLSRGLGITALLAGESGTGKTMAAEALANELRLDLYRIDLASVVSKYIGETEKNLRTVFDAAEEGGAVLLFDEADAIFGRRSEVQDSHDRYANIEVSYLLQRMEAYQGLAILTTNMKSALDPAFVRRLRFIITFPFPAAAQRERIWRGIFPTADDKADDPRRSRVPGVDRLDMAALARPGLTGGQIRNTAVNATFLAVAGDGAVTMELLREAAREELRKGGRPFVAADFAGWTTRHDAADEPRVTAGETSRPLVKSGEPS